MNYGEGSRSGMRAIDHYIDLLETAAWCVYACEDITTGVCAVPSNKLSYSQSRAVQEANVSGILPKILVHKCHLQYIKQMHL